MPEPPQTPLPPAPRPLAPPFRRRPARHGDPADGRRRRRRTATLNWRLPLPAGRAGASSTCAKAGASAMKSTSPWPGARRLPRPPLVQRFADQGMSPEAYLGHIASGLAALQPLHHQRPHQRRGAKACPTPPAPPTAGASARCDYGYVVAQKVIRDGDHLFVVEREWRLPPLRRGCRRAGPPRPRQPADSDALKRDIRATVRWLVEQVHPGAPPPAIDPRAAGADGGPLSRPGAFRAQSAFSFPPAAVRLFASSDHLRQPEIRPRPDDPFQRADRPARLAQPPPPFRRTRRRPPARPRILGPIFVKFGQMLSTSAATCCRRPSPTSWPACRTGCRPSPPKKPLAQLHGAYGARWTRSSPASTTSRWPRPRSPRCISPSCLDGTEVAVKMLRRASHR